MSSGEWLNRDLLAAAAVACLPAPPVGVDTENNAAAAVSKGRERRHLCGKISERARGYLGGALLDGLELIVRAGDAVAQCQLAQVGGVPRGLHVACQLAQNRPIKPLLLSQLAAREGCTGGPAENDGHRRWKLQGSQERACLPGHML
eukprot:1193459-Prorocentrum_minimum.AAC.3